MNIFLAPRSNETSYKNFLSTIEAGVDYSIVEPHLSEEGKKILSQKSKLFAWGNKESKKPSWDKLTEGDLVLFYKGKEGQEKESKFIFAGKLLYKQFSSNLGLALWPPKKGEDPWSCVYFLDQLTPVYIPISDITSLSGSYHFSIVQGFMPLNEEAVKNFERKYGTVENFLSKYSPSEMDEFRSELEEHDVKIAHREAQMLLLKMGKMLGFETYCPDKSQNAYGEQLDAHITLGTLPKRFIGDEMYPFVSQIDVIWFRDDVPVYAFEVEESTGVGSGMQRLQQLVPIAEKLFIIAPLREYPKYQKFLNGNTFFKFKDKYTFKDYDQLERYFNSVSEFSKLRESFLT